ncbi:MAG TPA: L-histidine N(alpha)-methyltransferase [Gammaproteobacteria bacterium]|nr:L-histidine N(alpha)-methyltransferase [Gammaproteobacteria bacterium]
MSTAPPGTSSIHFHDFHPALADFRSEVLAGLAQAPKQLSPKFFYDYQGSRLFEAITELPEYYPTRTEIGILERHGESIAEFLGRDCLLLELGSGSSRKIRVLLDALQPAAYMPVDISREHLLGSAQALVADYPSLEVHAACADYSQDFELPHYPEDLPRAAFFPGSSIGNFEPAAACELLQRVADHLGEGGRLLVGVDLQKDSELLHAAYNDAQQVTAAFNLNLLERINRELDADFDLDRFSHHAFYNETEGRVEMHLVSQCRQTVSVAGERFEFAEGETIHTENSYKYSVEGFLRLAQQAGFTSDQVWTDEQQLFSVHCLRCVAA